MLDVTRKGSIRNNYNYKLYKVGETVLHPSSMTLLRSKLILIPFALCAAGTIYLIIEEFRSRLQDGYAVLPLLVSDHVLGDTFPDQKKRLSLAEPVNIQQNGSDIFISVLTTHKYHDSRLSRLFITWMQTVEPKQVS